MEAQAEPRRALKRRKQEESKSSRQGSEANIPSLAPASSPPGARGDVSPIQDPPPGVEQENGVDRISLLPDAILGEIISLLPTKDAARTQTLAARWPRIWRSAPINLDGSDCLTMDVVSRILSAHQGPVRRFCFPAEQLQDHPATVDAWLRSPVLNNLQEIDCRTDLCSTEVLPPPPPPVSTFRFSSSLCVATFSLCHFPHDIAQALQFPVLKKLALERVSISEDSLHSIIAASPVLECFLLSRSIGFHRVRINSASLTSIGLGANGSFEPTVIFLQEFIVEDAPRLKRIMYHRLRMFPMQMQVSVISAPNLETLGCLNRYDFSSRLTLGSMIIEPCRKKEFLITNSSTPACTIKILGVHTLNLNLDAIIDLMSCFPCLEKLYIHSCEFEGGGRNLWRRKHRNLINCIDIRLKTVVLNNYKGIRSQVNFATFFVLNAKMLESMTFQCRNGYDVSKRFLTEQHQLLQLEKRASRFARFYFTNDKCGHEFMHINHVHDLSITDPFECVETRVGVCASF